MFRIASILFLSAAAGCSLGTSLDAAYVPAADTGADSVDLPGDAAPVDAADLPEDLPDTGDVSPDVPDITDADVIDVADTGPACDDPWLVVAEPIDGVPLADVSVAVTPDGVAWVSYVSAQGDAPKVVLKRVHGREVTPVGVSDGPGEAYSPTVSLLRDDALWAWARGGEDGDNIHLRTYVGQTIGTQIDLITGVGPQIVAVTTTERSTRQDPVFLWSQQHSQANQSDYRCTTAGTYCVFIGDGRSGLQIDDGLVQPPDALAWSELDGTALAIWSDEIEASLRMQRVKTDIEWLTVGERRTLQTDARTPPSILRGEEGWMVAYVGPAGSAMTLAVGRDVNASIPTALDLPDTHQLPTFVAGTRRPRLLVLRVGNSLGTVEIGPDAAMIPETFVAAVETPTLSSGGLGAATGTGDHEIGIAWASASRGVIFGWLDGELRPVCPVQGE